MDEMTKGLALGIPFLAISAAGVSPVARRLGAKRYGYFPALISTLLLLLSAVFFSQSNLSVGWVSTATLLFGTIAFGVVLGLSLFRGAVAVMPVVAMFYACVAVSWVSARL